MDTDTSDLSKAVLAEHSSHQLSEALNRGELVTTGEINEWFRQQDPLHEVATLEYVTALSLRSRQLVLESIKRRSLRAQTFRTAGYLTTMRAYVPLNTPEGSLAECDALTDLQTSAGKYYDQKSPQEKDVAMTGQDVTIFALLNGDARTDDESTKQLILAAHLIYDAITDSADLTRATEHYRQTITKKDAIILSSISKQLQTRVPDLLEDGNLDVAFSATQVVMMVDSYFLNQYSHPTVKHDINKNKYKDVFLNLRKSIETILPYIDSADPRQLGKLYEMVWLFNAHALKMGLGRDRLSIWPTNMAKDEPYIGKPKKKRNVDIVFLGDRQDKRTIRIQLKARAANRNKARKTTHPDVYISPDGEDFTEEFLATLPAHLFEVTRAAVSNNRQLLRRVVLETVQDSFTQYEQTSKTTGSIGSGVMSFVNEYPELQNGLQVMTEVEQAGPNRAQRRTNKNKKR